MKNPFRKNKETNLKNLLQKSFPNHKITVVNNKDGSQTISLLLGGVTTIRETFYRHLTGDPGVSNLVSVLYKTVYFVKCGAVSRKRQKKISSAPLDGREW